MLQEKIIRQKHKLSILIILVFSFILHEGCGTSGYILNYGLSKPQNPATLPKSFEPPPITIRKIKATPKTYLKPLKDGGYSILSGWELIESSKVKDSAEVISQLNINTHQWYNAKVPGTVLTTLVNEGVYPDPYYGLNNLYIPDSLCREDWWYRTTFKIPEIEKGKNVWLHFNGINYKAEIWMNGKFLGKMAGAFKRGIFNATRFINYSNENVLAVKIIPPPDPGIPHEESPSAGTGPNGGQLCKDGPTFISSEGWDWIPGIRDRDIGIWQNVNLKFTGPVSISDPQVITSLPLPDTSKADITIKTGLFNSSNNSEVVTLIGKIENVTFSKTVKIAAGEKVKISFTPVEYSQLRFNNPRLWWPNGYGSPELYNLELTAIVNNEQSDYKITRFGIREISYELMVNYPDNEEHRIEFDPVKDTDRGKLIFDNIKRINIGKGVDIPTLRKNIDTSQFKILPVGHMGPYLVIKINGKKIYCRGGNWGMDDAMKRVSRERLEPYFKLHQDEHFNMIRNWTGESTEKVFYDLADEYGMLVWNDFWMSTEGYNLEPVDKKLFIENVKDVIKRFRNHPSIALWCPRNEGYAPISMEDDIAKIVADEDGTRYYQPNSRYMNLTPSGPWNYFKNPVGYFKNIARGFDTEIGTPSVPTSTSLLKMMSAKDVWPISDVWYYHDFHNGLVDYRNAINTLYGKPESLDDFCKKAQMINYDSYRAIFEAWNSKLWNNTSGVLLWMSHPAWPSTEWQTYSWDYETFGSYYGSQKACEPIHVQMNLSDGKISILNTTLKSYKKLQTKITIYDVQGRQLYVKEEAANAKANSLTKCFTPKIPSSLPDIYLERLLLSDDKGKIISTNDYWKSKKKDGDFLELNKLPNVKLNAKLVKDDNRQGNKFTIILTNPSETPAVSVKLDLVDVEGKILLPAYFSDGYFNLLPGQSKRLVVDYGIQNAQIAGISVSGYNVMKGEVIKLN